MRRVIDCVLFTKSLQWNSRAGDTFLVKQDARKLAEVGRESSAMRDDPTAEAKGVLGENTIFGPIHNAKISLQCGRYDIEVQVDSLCEDGSKSWVVVSRGWTDTLRKFCQDANSPCTQKPSLSRTQVRASSGDVCNWIQSKSTTYEKIGTKQSSSKITFDTSHRQCQKFCARSSNSVSSSEPGGEISLA